MFRKKHFYGAVSKNNKGKNGKLLLVIFLCVLVFIGIELAQTLWREYQINKEMDSLKDEITKYDNENNDLEKMLKYYDTLSYKEKEARLKLNLQKPGEKTILVDSVEESAETEVRKETKEVLAAESNIKKWWNYFFEKKN